MKDTKISKTYLAAVSLVMLSACDTEIDGYAYESACLSIQGGDVKLDCDSGTFEIKALNMSVKDNCPPFGRVVIQAGMDRNGNCMLDDDEMEVNIDDPNPGGSAMFGGASGSSGGAEKGFRKIRVEDESGHVLFSSVTEISAE